MVEVHTLDDEGPSRAEYRKEKGKRKAYESFGGLRQLKRD